FNISLKWHHLNRNNWHHLTEMAGTIRTVVSTCRELLPGMVVRRFSILTKAVSSQRMSSVIGLLVLNGESAAAWTVWAGRSSILLWNSCGVVSSTHTYTHSRLATGWNAIKAYKSILRIIIPRDGIRVWMTRFR